MWELTLQCIIDLEYAIYCIAAQNGIRRVEGGYLLVIPLHRLRFPSESNSFLISIRRLSLSIPVSFPRCVLIELTATIRNDVLRIRGDGEIEDVVGADSSSAWKWATAKCQQSFAHPEEEEEEKIACKVVLFRDEPTNDQLTDWRRGYCSYCCYCCCFWW